MADIALRSIAASFVVDGPSGVAIRTRLKGLSDADETILRLVGVHLGALASRDLAVRCRDGLGHSRDTWTARKRELTAESSSRWAGAVTKATHDQWALARRGQAAHVDTLARGVTTLRYRLSLPVGQKGAKGAPGGYRSRHEWFVKSRRLATLTERHAAVLADRAAGRVRVVRGGKKLANTRHNLVAAHLTEQQWRQRWEAGRWFIAADGESGKRFGNETIRLTPDGEISIRLPSPLARHANAKHGRYILAAKVAFAHRGQELADRIATNQAVAYRVHWDTGRGRWYVTASWRYPHAPQVPLAAALTGGVVGVDTNDDHLAAWQLDVHGNPVGEPVRFPYDLSGVASHRDAHIRHTLTRLLHWAKRCGVMAIAVEDLDFAVEKTREKHGRNKRFRRLISRFPTARLRGRLLPMAAVRGVTVIAVDPAYTSRWGAQHWQKSLTTPRRKTTRHDSAAVAIGRRALGHPIRRRTAPPPHHQSDDVGHRTAQARPGTRGREEPRHRRTGPRTRCAPPDPGTNAGNQDTQHRSGCPAEHEHGYCHQNPRPLSQKERF